MHAWQGLTADGPPEAGVAWFAAGTTAADMAALAWVLEENTRLFYGALAEMRPGTDEADLFLALVDAEEQHKTTIANAHANLTKAPIDRFYGEQPVPVLEGGVEMEQALKWAEDKPARRVLNMAMGLEANAYDRYLKMMERAGDKTSRAVFRTVAIEERGHLKSLGILMDEAL